MLQSLRLSTVATEMQLASLEDSFEKGKKSKVGATSRAIPASVMKRKQNPVLAPRIAQPVRLSKRLRGLAAPSLEIGENDNMLQGEERAARNDRSRSRGSEADGNADGDSDSEIDRINLMSGDLYFDKETREKAIRVDGHYKGWLHPDLIEKYGFEKTSEEAWEANGGGSFSFGDPLGQTEQSSAFRSKFKKPKHDAKMVSKASFKKNPNAFFYRHNEPGQEQWMGDWTQEESELFLKVAREHGCGDKWGLFSSHIPHRVGYQCSNHYRQVVLPEGLVFDPNYKYTSTGSPVYCGKYNKRR
ncbi:hypothetical protein BC939DRAFT_251022 [Gamsiella multidivaricata]|uniref:uncharacterized protein n=1 Tax=Gamsiella multidivaricata TaxID=101098 RepID=UPI00221F596C|nr:uncharacterized protein BC939DRAFT_251022 [Gamsiella multidivaricata]KAI7819704.1 hypothetical protein BC939DRAFT_251022 [Gamsiella multidivaricata]